MNKLFKVSFFLLLAFCRSGFAQQFTKYVYYDANKKNVKEVYQVSDTISNTLDGRYVSYFLNGNIESKGQYLNNETNGTWEFYYETGNLKMRGILQNNTNFGKWEYFFESGIKSMEGILNETEKEGAWKVYYESGDLKEVGSYQKNKRVGLWKNYYEGEILKGEIRYEDNAGEYVEYSTKGKIIARGTKVGNRNFGLWKYFDDDGNLESEGSYLNGKKQGDWKYYYPSGNISSEGQYENDEPNGQWKYYFDDGELSSNGEFLGGKKNGYWSSFDKGGIKKSDATFENNSGQYKEYYPDGKLKIIGQITDGKNNGLWLYYFQDGKKEGECSFVEGKGIYTGYYSNGKIQTKGTIEEDTRVGTWQMYDQNGKLSGYYKPFYENNPLVQSINEILKKGEQTAQQTEEKKERKIARYFKPKNTEYLGVVLGGNPIFAFVGSMPFSVEFYNQERLGHEFVFEGLRDPFFTSDENIPQNKIFSRGYAMAMRQKYYNPMKTGMWYFGQEFRFTNLSYYSNIRPQQATSGTITASASEQKAEYGLLLGIRFMKNNKGDGTTIDIFGGYSAGYRWFDSDPTFTDYFTDVNKNKWAYSFRIGVNIGYSISFDGNNRRP